MKIKNYLYSEEIVRSQPIGLLDGKLILVIGAGSGIGQSIALSAEKAGANVIIAGRSKNSLSETVDLMRDSKFFIYDVNKVECVEEKLQEFCKEFGRLPDVIINSAGYRSINSQRNDFFSVTEEEWDMSFLTNYYGNIYLVEDYYKQLMLKEKTGKYIAISSIDGLQPVSTPYGISKACMNEYIEEYAGVMNDHLKLYGIAPGPTATRMMNANMNFKYYRKDHLNNRCALPQDIANLVVYMASERAHIKNGSIIVCDGGKTL